MSWLDANEVFLMEVVSRDRVEELRAAIDAPSESADETEEPVEEGWWAGQWAWRLVSAARA
jgi:hypothetical protein